MKYLEEMYKNLISGDCISLTSDSDFSSYELNSVVESSVPDIYYYVDSLSTFYDATSNEKRFENLLKLQASDWYGIFDTFSEKQHHECVSILEDLTKSNGKKIVWILDVIKDYSIEEIAYKIAVEKYQYAIILEKVSILNDTNEVISMIDSLPIKDGQKVLLKYCFVYQNINQFTEDETTALTNYLFNEKYSLNGDVAAALLEKMGYRVEKKGNTYTTYWN